MSKLFEYVSKYHRTTETLNMRECGQGLYVGVNRCELLPYGGESDEAEYEEQTTSIVVPFSEIPGLIHSLSKFTSGWIDYELRQPTEKGVYLIRDHQGRIAVGKYDNWFYKEWGAEKWGIVSHWMIIPELLEKGVHHG